MSNAPLAARLAEHFTVFNYTVGVAATVATRRRMRSSARIEESTPSSAKLVARRSSRLVLRRGPGPRGGSQALHEITKVALWEPPFILDDSRPRPPADTARIYTELVAAGRRGDASSSSWPRWSACRRVRRPGAHRAVVAGARGPGAHARLRRHDHGRLLAADRAGRLRHGAHAVIDGGGASSG